METTEMVGRPSKTGKTMTASERSKRRNFKLQAQAQLGRDFLTTYTEQTSYASDKGSHVRDAMKACVADWVTNTIADSTKQLGLTMTESVELVREILPEAEEISEAIADGLSVYKELHGA